MHWSPFDVEVRTLRRKAGAKTMWDTIQTDDEHLSHDLACLQCGHAAHSYLPCSDTCACVRSVMPGSRVTIELAA